MSEPIVTPKVDRITGAAQTIDWEHSKIHNGESFTILFSDGTPTNAGEMTAIGFTTSLLGPAGGRRVHLVVDAEATFPATLLLIENPTVILDQGTGLGILNRDRESTNVSQLRDQDTARLLGATSYTVVQAAAGDVDVGGIHLIEEIIGQTGNPVSIQGGRTRGQREWILSPGADYTLLLSNLTADTNVHVLAAHFYESIHKDFAN